MVIVAGIDPAGSPKKYTGVAVLDNYTLLCIARVKKDEEITSIIHKYKPVVIAIDSPLSHAPGYRKVDIAMKIHGYQVLPPGWRSMRMLIDRSLRLKKLFEERGAIVIETHPRSALKSSGCKNPEDLYNRIGFHIEKPLSKDENDALISAIVALYYAIGDVIEISDVDGTIYLLPPVCRS
ncbi:MAG: hypothetical protein ABWW65_04965 [Thermoprotei archaeon]